MRTRVLPVVLAGMFPNKLPVAEGISKAETAALDRAAFRAFLETWLAPAKAAGQAGDTLICMHLVRHDCFS
jgi:hypothetical protein